MHKKILGVFNKFFIGLYHQVCGNEVNAAMVLICDRKKMCRKRKFIGDFCICGFVIFYMLHCYKINELL
jgi:hypothetical protein